MDYLYLGLGSNLGDREKLLHQAIGMLTERIGGLERLSAFYDWNACPLFMKRNRGASVPRIRS